MSEQDKRAVSICEAMADIPRATSPRTPLVWAYEVKAERDELLAALKQVVSADSYRSYMAAKTDAHNLIKKIEATL